MITQVEIPFGKEYNEFVGDALLRMCAFKSQRITAITYDSEKHELVFHYEDETVCKIQVTSSNNQTGCIISQTEFQKLQEGSELRDKYGKTWKVVTANCGGPGKYPTHFLESPSSYTEYIFHDGEHMRFLNHNDVSGEAVCGSFTIY
ncbi:MAG: hypothetical protein WC908_00560 [Candidatus Paceibacterota bacterium]